MRVSLSPGTEPVVDVTNTNDKGPVDGLFDGPVKDTIEDPDADAIVD
jgi:hypothetical protein